MSDNEKQERVPKPEWLPALLGAPEPYVIGQSVGAGRVAAILVRCAEDLFDIATLDAPEQMWEEARAVASRVLACCPVD